MAVKQSARILIMNRTGFKYLILTIALLTIQRILVKWYPPIGLVLAVVALLFFSIHLLKSKKQYSLNNIDRSSRLLIFILIVYSLSIVLRGFPNMQNHQISPIGYFTHALFITPYFLPFIAIYTFSARNIKTLLKVSNILAIIFIIYAIICWKDILQLNSIGLAHFTNKVGEEYNSSIFTFYAELTSLCAPFVIFLIQDYIPKKYHKIATINIVIAFIIAVIAGRRTSTFTIGLVFIAYYFLIYKKKTSGTIKILFITFTAIIILYNSGLLDFFISKIDNESRLGVEESFIADMDYTSWIIGRGALGSYFDIGFTYSNPYRTEIETGYLYLILKGGIIYLIIYVTVLLRAFYLGYFKSNNTFTKAFACLALICCIELIPFGVPMLNIKFFSLWLGVGICLNKRIRALSNEDIKAILN